MYYLEKACEIQISAQAGGSLVIPCDEVCRRTERQFNEPSRPAGEGELSDPDGLNLAWAALLRLLDRVAPDYKN
ncbi:aldolase II superfamily protein [compost metagenome]